MIGRRAPVVAEVVLALVLALFVGRLTVHTSHAPTPGAVDVGFSQDMAVHHEQAVLMADLARSHAGVAVAALADAILVTQSEEIGMMRGWLQLWHRPAASPSPMAWLPSGDSSMPGMSMPGMSMPGMATPAQLADLETLTGTRFDVLFLQLMIRHHQGGLAMAQYAQAHARLAVVRSAAQAMAFQQIEDIRQMRPLLAADGASPLPPP